MAMYGVEMMLPTYLQNIHGFSPFESGLTLLAGALMLGFISPISGSLYNKIGIKRLTFVDFNFNISIFTVWLLIRYHFTFTYISALLY